MKNCFLTDDCHMRFTRPVPTMIDSEILVNLRGREETAGEFIKDWSSKKCRTAEERRLAKIFLDSSAPIDAEEASDLLAKLAQD